MAVSRIVWSRVLGFVVVDEQLLPGGGCDLARAVDQRAQAEARIVVADLDPVGDLAAILERDRGEVPGVAVAPGLAAAGRRSTGVEPVALELAVGLGELVDQLGSDHAKVVAGREPQLDAVGLVGLALPLGQGQELDLGHRVGLELDGHRRRPLGRDREPSRIAVRRIIRPIEVVEHRHHPGARPAHGERPGPTAVLASDEIDDLGLGRRAQLGAVVDQHDSDRVRVTRGLHVEIDAGAGGDPHGPARVGHPAIRAAGVSGVVEHQLERAPDRLRRQGRATIGAGLDQLEAAGAERRARQHDPEAKGKRCHRWPDRPDHPPRAGQGVTRVEREGPGADPTHVSQRELR